ncbi:hypothetical protein CWI75_16150 [Kineobactrum sediminis]|uniref:Tetracycline repressor TetR C-terminal domain-containing protein n=1 Tax=Kineobactrum sediminis TaxID=1905677 RepID=A0A2N5XYY8_9GAMM|nr:TetR/AcrR family transcriptional regulator C-terminal domain-containing protein [Kineobactrum sediminis]PLW81364.1 hypothetical protein CWI75_16150 [Kineobactrum sediminis]
MLSPTHNGGKRRGAGRPRRLTLEAIVDAACELEPSELGMASIASRLKVGVATLYGYVDGREHLLRLIAERKGQIEPIVDRGQSWQAILREHAASLYQTAIEWPELVSRIMQGGVFGQEEALYLEHLAELLCARGFSPGRVLDVYYGINQVILGAVVTDTYLRAARAAGGHDTLLRQYLTTQPGAALPNLRQALEQNPTPAVLADYQQAAERFIEQCQPDQPQPPNNLTE